MKIEFDRIPIIGKVLPEPSKYPEELAVIETDKGVQLVLEELIADANLSQIYRAKKLNNRGDYGSENLVVKMASKKLMTEGEDAEKFGKLLYLQESFLFVLFPSLSPDFSMHIPKVYDTIGLKKNSKYPGIVIEELFGESLTERAMTFNEKLETMIEVGIILYEIHKTGFVHRDVKPSNIYFRNPYKRGELTSGVVIIDGGFAHHPNMSFIEPLNFKESFNLGTPAYMDEIALQGDIFHLSDAYAYAMTVGETLAGLKFWENEESKPNIGTIKNRKHVPNKISKQIPFLDDLLHTVLHKDIELRPDAGQIVEILQKIYVFYHDKEYVPEYMR